MITLNEFKRRFDKEWEKGNISGLDPEDYKGLQQKLREPGQRMKQIEKERKLTTDPQKLDDLYYDRIYTGNKYHDPRQQLRETYIRMADNRRRLKMGAGSYDNMTLQGNLRSNRDIHIQTEYPNQRDYIRQQRLDKIKKKNFNNKNKSIVLYEKPRRRNTTQPIQNETIIAKGNRRTLNATSSSNLISQQEGVKRGLAKINNSYTPTTNTPTTQTVSNATSTSTNSIPKSEPKVTSNTYAPSGNDVKKTTQAVGNAGNSGSKRKYTKTMMEYWNNLGKGGKVAVGLGTAAVIGGGLYGGYKLMNRDRNNTRK